jgi:nicotinamidase/pyrazinamidase
LYVPGAERVVDTVARLNRWAVSQGIPVISTIDAHAENDPEFVAWPPHCVAGAWGQQKPLSTLLEERVTLQNAPGPLAVAGAQQILLEKQSVNCFTAVQLVNLLDELQADRCVVYGVVTEVCVRHAALGLLGSGRKVEVVSDAVRSLNDAARDEFLAEFAKLGGTLTSASVFT